MNTFTNPKNGESIESPLTQPEVYTLLANLPGQFPADLRNAMRRGWSQSQAFWAHKLALGAMTPKAEKAPEAAGQFGSLFPLFNKAKTEGLKRPRIRFMDNGSELSLSTAPDTGNNPGHLYFKINNIYAGKITPSGAFYKAGNCPPEAAAFLTKFAQNPLGAAKEYGDNTGECCFCGRELTDDRSVSKGWGPICAGKWGLPWGD